FWTPITPPRGSLFHAESQPGWEVECGAVVGIARALHDRHTDLLVLGREELPRRIDHVALETGVLL
ncbi:MAG: hypothetical protein ACOYOH_12880, partial [Paracraurococcus sp.]